MKKLIETLTIAVVLTIFIACDNNNDDDSIKISIEQILGRWDAYEVQFNNDGKWLDITSRPELRLGIIFYDDGTYYGSGALGDGEGTYSVKGNTIKTYIDGSLYATYKVLHLSGYNAEMTITIDGESMLIRVRKSRVVIGETDSSIANKRWQRIKRDGDIIYEYELTFDAYNYLDYCVTTYKIDDSGTNSVTVDGQTIKVKFVKRETGFYLYSCNGETLVVRGFDTTEEEIFEVKIQRNELSIRYKGSDIVFQKLYDISE